MSQLQQPVAEATAAEWMGVIRAHAHVITEAATEWTDGHILGNGDVGAVVWGTPERVSIGLSKHNVWNLTHCAGGGGNRWTMPYPEVVRRVMAGDRQVLQEVGIPQYAYHYEAFQISCGILDLDVLRGQLAVGLTQQLSFLDGECRVEATPSPFGYCWGMDYQPITVTTFVHAETNVVVVKLESGAPQRVGWRYARPATQVLTEPTYTVRDGATAVMSHTLACDEHYAVAITGAGAECTVSASTFGIDGMLSFGGERGPAYLFLSMAAARDAECGNAGAHPAPTPPPQGEAISEKGHSSKDGMPEDRAVALAVAARDAVYDELQATHRAWWHAFWEKSALEYEDHDLTQLWYMGLYALASSTRPQTSPPHLQGLWNQYDIPPWHTDYHFNVNVQESHWAACSANHPELQEALVRCLTQDWREQFRNFTRDVFQCDGLAMPFCNDWLGRSLGGWWFDVELSTTAWAAQHVWQQWRYTGDRALLHDTVYPFLREVAEFYTHVLFRDAHGQYNIELSHSPEQYWYVSPQRMEVVTGRNPSLDVALITELMESVVAAGAELGITDSFIAQCAEIAAHMPPLPTLDGILIDNETGFFFDGDKPGYFPIAYRHPSRLVPIFPCEMIGLHSDPATLELGRKSFREFLSYGWHAFTGWSYSFLGCLAARLGFGDEAQALLREQYDHFLFKGLLTSHNRMTGPDGPLFQIEALLGMPAALTEMCLQAVGGAIRVFPAIPAGKRARFHQLRVPGGILVDAAYDGTRVTALTLQCERNGAVRLVNPYGDGAVRVVVDDGDRLTLTGAEVQWQGCAGRRYHIMPA